VSVVAATVRRCVGEPRDKELKIAALVAHLGEMAGGGFLIFCGREPADRRI